MKYQIYGSQAILITWESRIDHTILNDILLVKEIILTQHSDEIQDCTNGYNSLLIVYKREVSNQQLTSLAHLCNSRKQNKKSMGSITWEIPVCYHISMGMDLNEFANLKDLKTAQVIEMHSAPVYTVYCKGFLPGFMYLGGLNERLYCDRKAVPLLQVPKNSVAIGGKQTGIYPIQSPGGWHIIGKTPVNLFDMSKKEPSKIKTGDRIKFKVISLTTYIEMDLLTDKTKLIKKID
ncbi:5-oxoprolinase subunit PxpB [Aquimarina agarilytica]|uniref:5-oxoprolinase subunit PxpB n=1 Tax=Aquimarina agarilytica TaxID=1087449 RepID=UPI0002893A1E|nr:5-oxoprolinase subunit PxpB [Aquimarina agarilytica]